METVI